MDREPTDEELIAAALLVFAARADANHPALAKRARALAASQGHVR